MKKIYKLMSFFLCLIICLVFTLVCDAYAIQAYYANTGDKNFDAVLVNVNTESKTNYAGFISGINQTYNIPEATIRGWLFNMNLVPADVYLIAGIAKILNIPVDVVFNKYQANKAQGWGYIAKQLGIKPGSKEFHLLKSGSVTILENTKNKSKTLKSSKPGKVEKQGKGNKDKKYKKK